MNTQYWLGILTCLSQVLTHKEIQAAASGCGGAKYCNETDPDSGEQITYAICNSALVNGKCPPVTDKMITNCQLKKYKEPGQSALCVKCSKNGQPCEKYTDCCQSYTNSKAAAGLPVIMFANCIKKKCKACLNVKFPCGKGSKIPCCGELIGDDRGIGCRNDITLSPLYPNIYPICAPPPCNLKALDKLELYNLPCYNYGAIKNGTSLSNPQYTGVNMCSCAGAALTENVGYNCKSSKCVKCKLAGLGTDSECTSNDQCCTYHTCKPLGEGNGDKKECFQDHCTLESKRGCAGPAGIPCCGGIRCVQIPASKHQSAYSICTKVKCTEQFGRCSFDYHCCQGLKCETKELDGTNSQICL